MMPMVEMGESRTPRPEPAVRDQLRACPVVCRRSIGRPPAACRSIQPRVPKLGLAPAYAALSRAAVPLHDASTTRGTKGRFHARLSGLRPREREQTGGCQLLRLPPVLRGLTAPRLAFPDSQTLSRPRIPTEPNAPNERSSSFYSTPRHRPSAPGPGASRARHASPSPPPVQRRRASASSRSISRRASRSAIARRRSWSRRPRARPSSTLASPRSVR